MTRTLGHCPKNERLSVKMTLDRHVVMWQDMVVALQQRDERQKSLKESLATYEETPLETFARTNDMGPLPVSLARYTELLPQRMAARLLATGTMNMLDIVRARNAMIDIITARYNRHTGHWGAPTPRDLHNDERTQRQAELALRLLTQAEQQEQQECRHWAH